MSQASDQTRYLPDAAAYGLLSSRVHALLTDYSSRFVVFVGSLLVPVEHLLQFRGAGFELDHSVEIVPKIGAGVQKISENEAGSDQMMAVCCPQVCSDIK